MAARAIEPGLLAKVVQIELETGRTPGAKTSFQLGFFHKILNQRRTQTAIVLNP